MQIQDLLVQDQPAVKDEAIGPADQLTFQSPLMAKGPEWPAVIPQQPAQLSFPVMEIK